MPHHLNFPNVAVAGTNPERAAIVVKDPVCMVFTCNLHNFGPSCPSHLQAFKQNPVQLDDLSRCFWNPPRFIPMEPIPSPLLMVLLLLLLLLLVLLLLLLLPVMLWVLVVLLGQNRIPLLTHSARGQRGGLLFGSALCVSICMHMYNYVYTFSILQPFRTCNASVCSARVAMSKTL